MKKTLVAIAALAAFGAQAQSTVTISGTFDASVNSAKTTYQTGAAVTQNTLSHSNKGTSGIIFSGVEDLGAGNKAEFLYEFNFNPANGGDVKASSADKYVNATTFSGAASNDSSFQSGQIYAGLSGAFGSLKVGVPNTPTLTAQTSRQFFGTKKGGGFDGVLGTGHVRNDGTILYTTPSFSGLTAAVAFVPKTKADVNKHATTASENTSATGAITDIGLNYANGPLRAGVSSYTLKQVDAYTNVSAVAAVGKNEQTNAYVQYDIGALTLAGGFHTEKTAVAGSAATVDAKGQNLAAKYALTPTVTLLANTAKLDSKLSTNLDKKINAIGAEYSLSKRSVIYARHAVEKNDNVTTATSSTDVKTTMVGLFHSF